MNLRQLILRFRKLDHFHINTELFPKETQGLISVDDIKRYKALPLGVKGGGCLNVGLVDPYRLDARDAMTALASKNGKSIHFYSISAEDFQSVLKSVYHI